MELIWSKAGKDAGFKAAKSAISVRNLELGKANEPCESRMSIKLSHQKPKQHRPRTHHPMKQHGKARVDWNSLDEKIQDWFSYAKTPEQRVVYRFLKDLNEDEVEDDVLSIQSTNHSLLSDRAQSLEDILNNLKQYRSKFASQARREKLKKVDHNSNNNFPKLDQNSHGNDNNPRPNRITVKHCLSDSTEKLNLNHQAFESSTWRVMRQFRSADIRNKYPLPKANPDSHFRNNTIFFTANRPPKSTFLLHPDWV